MNQTTFVKQYELEPSAKDMRNWITSAAERIVPFVESLSTQAVTNEKTVTSLLDKLREPIPKKGEDLDQLLDFIFRDVLPIGINLPSAGYLAYIPVGGLFHTVIAEFITTAINRWPGLYKFCPGFIEIENTVIAWLNEMIGMPETAGGILTSGGSLANFSAVVAARSDKLGEELGTGIIYCSDQAHHSVLKAAILAGIPRKNIRKIKTDPKTFRILIDDLTAAISADLDKNLKPFMLVGNAGTTNTGAVDHLDQLAQVARNNQLWFHVDAAWAGSFRLTPEGRRLMRGIEEADSVTIDPHKALFLPFGSGALLVRHSNTLRKAHSFEADYLPSEDENELRQADPSQLSPELSRTLRGLQVWLPIKMLGIQPFIDCLEEKLALTNWLTRELRAMPGIEIVAEPQTAIVAFRYIDKSEDQDSTNKRLLELINSDGSVLLSGTVLNGNFAIRVVPFGHRTHREHVELALRLIQKAVDKIRKNE